MKRGLIVWDESELPRSALENRLEHARAAAKKHEAPALVVYTDVWRSNHARALVNFMPYWGRSLLVVPVNAPALLLCGNSPRVYPWLGTVTFVDELRPTKDFAAGLVALAAERAWKRVGILDAGALPYDIGASLAESALDIVDVTAWDELGALDPVEAEMRRRAIEKARAIADADTHPRKLSERDVAAGLERSLRRAGMEDVVIRIAAGGSAPRLASDRAVDATTSVFVACEYRGHWVQLSRPLVDAAAARERFADTLTALGALAGKRYDLSGVLGYRAMLPAETLTPGRLVALHLTTAAGTLYGDTCRVTTATSAELL